MQYGAYYFSIYKYEYVFVQHLEFFVSTTLTCKPIYNKNKNITNYSIATTVVYLLLFEKIANLFSYIGQVCEPNDRVMVRLNLLASSQLVTDLN